MKRQITFFFLATLFFATPRLVSAQSAYTIPVVPISQQFTPQDANGDTGTSDCMAAALTMSLNSLARSDTDIQTEDLSYQRVRSTLRKAAPDITRGIPPGTLIAATPSLTNEEYHLVFSQVQISTWREYLTQELKRGFPVIVHVSDRNRLFDPLSEQEASHVIVVSQITHDFVTYADSWDGRFHTISDKRFVDAWGTGRYPWFAFAFEKKPLFTYKEIIKKRFSAS